MDQIQKFGTIEKVIENLDKAKYIVPEVFPFDEARKLFVQPDVILAKDIKPEQLKWKQVRSKTKWDGIAPCNCIMSNFVLVAWHL